MQYAGELDARKWGDEHMHMVARDREGAQSLASPIEVVQRVADDRCRIRPAEHARPMSGIQPVLHPLIEQLQVTLEQFSAQPVHRRIAMRTDERFTLASELRPFLRR
mgnify:CR=1 FL=1